MRKIMLLKRQIIIILPSEELTNVSRSSLDCRQSTLSGTETEQPLIDE